jgi:hypothetical protein
MTQTDTAGAVTTKSASWRRLLAVACGIGIVAVLALGIGLTFGLVLPLQVGIASASIAAIIALVGGYDYFTD